MAWFLARVMTVMFSITKQAAVQKVLIQNVFQMLIVVHTKLVMDISALILVQIFAKVSALNVTLKISSQHALANQGSMDRRIDFVLRMVVLNSIWIYPNNVVLNIIVQPVF